MRTEAGAYLTFPRDDDIARAMGNALWGCT